jgi:lincosamide nucleotidyltransferase A/C/D/E
VVRVVRRLHRTLAACHADAVLPARVVDGVRRRFVHMPAEEALEVIDALASGGLHPWVVGGWGVDALVGRATRRHLDLDVAVSAAPTAEHTRPLADAADALARLGYHPIAEEGPTAACLPHRRTFRNGAGKIVELFLISDERRHSVVPGVIAGRGVRCLSVDAQLDLHDGYEHRPVDRHDVRLLASLQAGSSASGRRVFAELA